MIHIIADTTCGIPKPVRDKLGIPFVGQVILIMGVSYRDDYELDTETFVKKLKDVSGITQDSCTAAGGLHPALPQTGQAGRYDHRHHPLKGNERYLPRPPGSPRRNSRTRISVWLIHARSPAASAA